LFSSHLTAKPPFLASFCEGAILLEFTVKAAKIAMCRSSGVHNLLIHGKEHFSEASAFESEAP
jgi:hypothetical protein